MSDKENKSFIAWLLILLLTSLATRLFFLFTTEHTLDMDECVVGIMIKRVAFQGDRFFHLSGSDYGGGHALIAYTLAPFAKLFGTGDILTQSMTVFSSIILIGVVVMIARRAASPCVGLMTGLLFSFSPSFFKASFQVNAYIETMLLAALALLFFQKTLDVKLKNSFTKSLYAVGFGFFSGAALWSFEFAAALLFPVFVSALFYVRNIGFKNLCFSALAFFSGWSVQINYLLHEKPSSSLFGRWITFNSASDYFHALKTLALIKFPDFFSPYIYHYPPQRQTYSLLLTLLFAVSFIFVLYAVFSALFAPSKKQKKVVLVVCVAVAYYFAALTLFKNAMSFPRYFLPLSPVIAFVFALTSSFLLNTKAKSRAFGIVLISLILILQIASLFDMSRCRMNSCQNRSRIFKTIEFLDNKGYEGIYTDFTTKWQIAFYSDERIIGSDFAFDNMPRHIPYELKIAEMDKVPFVFPSDWIVLEEIENGLKRGNVGYSKTEIEGLTLIYDIEKPIKPFDWLFF
ncbi:MAG TPA: glycosyltransferase family 39 protein [bacterium]|nr:glycosyltransferase family 39 protein [bacterium]